jgi:hypothetical protein
MATAIEKIQVPTTMKGSILFIGSNTTPNKKAEQINAKESRISSP